MFAMLLCRETSEWFVLFPLLPLLARAQAAVKVIVSDGMSQRVKDCGVLHADVR